MSYWEDRKLRTELLAILDSGGVEALRERLTSDIAEIDRFKWAWGEGWEELRPPWSTTERPLLTYFRPKDRYARYTVAAFMEESSDPAEEWEDLCRLAEGGEIEQGDTELFTWHAVELGEQMDAYRKTHPELER